MTTSTITVPRIIPAGTGPVYCGAREILQRIFVTVRDANWREIPPAVNSGPVAEEADGRWTLGARHTSDTVDFAWQGRLEVGSRARRLRFEFEGEVLRDMHMCRLGLVVLHPVSSIVGAELTATGPAGSQCLRVPHPITPQAIMGGRPSAMTDPFCELTITQAGFGSLELTLTGDLFELEDQRNWGDASFKTYCTPLRLGFPRHIRAGTRIAHSLEVRFTPALQPVQESSGLRGQVFRPFPALGRECAGADTVSSTPLGPHWSHVHLRLPREGAAAVLQQAMGRPGARGLEVSIETDPMHLPDPEVVAQIAQHHLRIVRLLLCGAGTSLPAQGVLGSWRQALARAGTPHIPLFASTRGYFADINRLLPLRESPDGVAFPLSTTVHGDDPDIIIENMVTVIDIARTVRFHLPESQMVLAPLALYHPPSLQPAAFPPGLIAPWLVATLLHASQAGIQSITLGDDIIRAVNFLATSRTPPLFTWLLRCVGARVIPVDFALPERVYAVSLYREVDTGRPGILAVNLSDQAAVLQAGGSAAIYDGLTGNALAGGPGGASLPPLAVAWSPL